MTLINKLMDEDDSRVFSHFERLVARDQGIENYLSNVKVLVGLFSRLEWTNQTPRAKFGHTICELMIRALESTELQSEHFSLIREIFQSFGYDLRSVSTSYEQFYTLYQSKSRLFGSSHLGISSEQRSTSTPSLPTALLAATTLKPARISCPSTINERLKDIREEESERRRIEDERVHREETERRRQRELEEEERRERIRTEEEERLKKEAEEEKKRREEAEKKRVEEERIQKEAAEMKRKAEEEKQRQAAEAKRQEEERRQQLQAYRNANPCTFFTATVYRHQEPNNIYTHEVFRGRIIGLYFARHQCQKSREFTPVLRDFHAQVREDFGVLFISMDDSELEMKRFLEEYHGDWFHLKYGSELGDSLKKKLNITVIPKLMILKPDRTVLKMDGYQDVLNCQNPRQLIDQWKLFTEHVADKMPNRNKVSGDSLVDKTHEVEGTGIDEAVEEKRKLEEEETRLWIEEEEWPKRGAEELKRLKKGQQEYLRTLPCTFLPDTIYRHKDPSSTYNQTVFNGKLIGLYFARHQCQESRDFMRVLRNFHAQAKDDFEILFISSDNNKEEMNMYLKKYHGDWFHLEYGSELGASFKEKLKVETTPKLVILKPNGTVLSPNGCSDVSTHLTPRTVIDYWKSFLGLIVDSPLSPNRSFVTDQRQEFEHFFSLPSKVTK
uniref:protein-disulfide reductase n=1 Tax=Caenorhabditis tropicalis TaxID=1561998 RepID=A0A1I7U457_9PELO